MKNDPLKSALREAAAGDAPAFSPFLHEKIMSRLRAAEPSQQFNRPPRSQGFLPLTAAASLLIAGSLFLFFHRTPPAATLVMPSPKEFSEPVTQLLAAAAAPARETLNDGKYARLDHDAEHLMFFLADQFPAPPTEPAKNCGIRGRIIDPIPTLQKRAPRRQNPHDARSLIPS